MRCKVTPSKQTNVRLQITIKSNGQKHMPAIKSYYFPHYLILGHFNIHLLLHRFCTLSKQTNVICRR